MARNRQLRRDDGTLVPLRERKVADAVLEALRIAGCDDRQLADELASAVVLYLDKGHHDGIPTEGEVDGMLERALGDTGHVEAARAYRELNEKRRRLARELTVRSPRSAPASALLPEGDDEVLPWNRARLVQGLVEKRELPESLAEEIAASVERRLIRCELRSITTALLLELVDYELLDRGLGGTGEKDRLLGVRTSDLKRALRVDEGPALLPDRVIGSEALARFALSEIHGDASVRAHHLGRLHIHGLGDPLKVERLAVPASLLLPSADAPFGLSLLAIREHLDVLRDHVRDEIVLPDLASAIAERFAAEVGATRLVEHLLKTLDARDAYGAPRRPRPHLHLALDPGFGPNDARSLFLDALLARVLGAPDGGERLALTLVVDRAPSAADDRRVAELLAQAALRTHTAFAVAREGDLPVRFSRAKLPVPLRLCLGKVALNLPLVLLDARERDLNGMLTHLEEPARRVAQALEERFWYQRGGSVQGLHGVVVHLGGPGFVQVAADGQEVDLDLWGLGYALEMLVRRGVVRRGDRPRAAATILGYLDYVLGEERAGVRFRVRLGGETDRDVRRRFLEALEAGATRRGDADLLALLHEGEADRSTLPVVVPVVSEANEVLVKAPFASRFGTGLQLSLAAFGEAPPSETIARVLGETALGTMTLVPSRPENDLFEVQEELFRDATTPSRGGWRDGNGDLSAAPAGSSRVRPASVSVHPVLTSATGGSIVHGLWRVIGDRRRNGSAGPGWRGGCCWQQDMAVRVVGTPVSWGPRDSGGSPEAPPATPSDRRDRRRPLEDERASR